MREHLYNSIIKNYRNWKYAWAPENKIKLRFHDNIINDLNSTIILSKYTFVYILSINKFITSFSIMSNLFLLTENKLLCYVLRTIHHRSWLKRTATSISFLTRQKCWWQLSLFSYVVKKTKSKMKQLNRFCLRRPCGAKKVGRVLFCWLAHSIESHTKCLSTLQ